VAVVLATKAHREGLESRLHAQGLNKGIPAEVLESASGPWRHDRCRPAWYDPANAATRREAGSGFLCHRDHRKGHGSLRVALRTGISQVAEIPSDL
jgi:hypothetical protein